MEGPAAPASADAVEVRQRIDAPLDRIWRACSSPLGLMNWQADEASGEAKKGGTLTLSWAAFGARVELQVVECIPYERLVMRHGESIVDLRLERDAVTLRHEGPEAAGDAQGLCSSWQVALAQLAHSVERHPGRQRRVNWFLRSIRCEPETAHLCFTDGRLLERWLCEPGMGEEASFGDPGSEYAMFLQNGQLVAGSVLTNYPGRDVALVCDSLGEGVLTLRTLPSPESFSHRLVALTWSEWGPPRSESRQLLTELRVSILRLVRLLDACASG